MLVGLLQRMPLYCMLEQLCSIVCVIFEIKFKVHLFKKSAISEHHSELYSIMQFMHHKLLIFMRKASNMDAKCLPGQYDSS